MFKRLASIFLPSLLVATPIQADHPSSDAHEPYFEAAIEVVNTRLRNGFAPRPFAIAFPTNGGEPTVFEANEKAQGGQIVAELLRGLIPMARDSKLAASVIIFPEFGGEPDIDGVLIFDIEVKGEQRRLTIATFKQKPDHVEFVSRKDEYKPAKIWTA